ncbi:hypothetical protein N0V90_011211 [Kalmusia sp. IMI 367209]|nr:hypothetical protein N0V90_011211 [Kalmusia sp. IMI 367209]
MTSSTSATEPTPEEQAFLQYQMSVKDQTRQPAFYTTVAVCMFLGYASIVLRLLARRKKGQKLKADDWWIIGALLPVSVWDAFNFWSIYTGLGLHIIRVTNPKALIQSAVGCMILYPMCLPPIKYSILFLYQRFFPSKMIRIFSITIAAIVTSMAIAASVSFALQCIPLSSLWAGTHGKCIELNKLAIATGQADPSWNNAIGGMWSVIEVHVAIVSANLPVLKPLFMKHEPETSASYARPIIKSSGYIRSEDSNGTSKKSKRRGPYSITNGSLWKDDDEVPLQDIEHGVQTISKQTQFEVHSVKEEQEKSQQTERVF